MDIAARIDFGYIHGGRVQTDRVLVALSVDDCGPIARSTSRTITTRHDAQLWETPHQKKGGYHTLGSVLAAHGFLLFGPWYEVVGYIRRSSSMRGMPWLMLGGIWPETSPRYLFTMRIVRRSTMNSDSRIP